MVPAGPLVPAGAGSPAGAIPPALAAADAEATLLDWQKLLVTSRALRLRRDHPDWFAGRYEPLAADGPAAEHAVAFARAGVAVTVITRLPGGLRDRGGWAGTTLALPGPAGPVRGDGSPAPPGDRPPRWRDVLTGAVHESPAPLLADLTAQLPVALLVAA